MAASLSITPDEINQYAERFTTPESSVLKELHQKTIKDVPGARMISGHLQGAFLQMTSKMLQPKNILELGTYTGYSAICLAMGLEQNGQLHTIDTDNSLQDLRNEYWEKAGLQNKIIQHIGPAAEVIPTIDASFDLVFIDADKRNYGLYFDLVLDKMDSGSWIIADNVLFHAEVILPEEERSKAAQHIHLFNEKIKNDNRVEQVLLPFRDGLTLMRKK